MREKTFHLPHDAEIDDAGANEDDGDEAGAIREDDSAPMGDGASGDEGGSRVGSGLDPSAIEEGRRSKAR